MNRREAIRSLFGLAGSVLLSSYTISEYEIFRDLHLIGLGGAGCNMLEYIHGQGLKSKYTAISSPVRYDLPLGIVFIEYGPIIKAPRDYSVMEMDLPISDSILELLEENNDFVLMVGLGGNTGSNLVRQLSKILQAKGKRFIVICQTPFTFEGKSRRNLASRTLNELQRIPRVHSFNLDSIRDKFGDLKLSEAFLKADEHCYQLLRTNLS
jgi:cell division protein FtsZ